MKPLEILTPDQAAERLHVSARVVRSRCKAGKLPGAQRFGRDWRIPSTALEAYFAAPAPPSDPDASRAPSVRIAPLAPELPTRGLSRDGRAARRREFLKQYPKAVNRP